MPKKRKSTLKYTSVRNKNNAALSFISQFKLGDSYMSLILGIVVVIVAAFLVISFAKNIKSKNDVQDAQKTLSQKTEELKDKTTSVQNSVKTYTVLGGDNLWLISEKVYKSGYNWVDLAKANKIENPEVIFKGTQLKIPDVEPKIIAFNRPPEPISNNKPLISISTEVQTNTISQNSYTIQRGDYLWEIAVRAYGDGFKWVEIARANNLTDPNLIFSENVLKIPR
ncbi:MAG: LysM peptidoglycan-binding domain-containing protein [Candidatus Levybacteria bacterium]|nr:LysM peptidoglycan-binding domain-containing protein [Candidatus Levybacteria bacterium]